jgi:hypothetical protein
MGSKLRPGEFDCYQNALPDEPTFVLLARDKAAPAAIRDWIQHRQAPAGTAWYMLSAQEMAMLAEAESCAAEMEAWRTKNEGVWRLVLPGGNRWVPAPWTKGRRVWVAFDGRGGITVNGKSGDGLVYDAINHYQMDSDESTVWNTFHNLLVEARTRIARTEAALAQDEDVTFGGNFPSAEAQIEALKSRLHELREAEKNKP